MPNICTKPEFAYTQRIAVGLIILAAICIGIGEKHGWRDLINFSMTFGGGGVGILTGQRLEQTSKPDEPNAAMP